MSSESAPGQSRYEKLKNMLLDGSLEPEAFLQKIYDLDQESDHTVNAQKNIEILVDPDISRVFENDPELSLPYFNLLSLSYFHSGQRKAGDKGGHDNAGALEDFRHALAATKHAEDPVNETWEPYVAGTVAYFERDLPRLRAICGAMDDEEYGANKQILEACLRQLENNEPINYTQAEIRAWRKRHKKE